MLHWKRLKLCQWGEEVCVEELRFRSHNRDIVNGGRSRVDGNVDTPFIVLSGIVGDGILFVELIQVCEGVIERFEVSSLRAF